MLFTKLDKQLHQTHVWLAAPACQNFASEKHIVFNHLGKVGGTRTSGHKVFIRHAIVRPAP